MLSTFDSLLFITCFLTIFVMSGLSGAYTSGWMRTSVYLYEMCRLSVPLLFVLMLNYLIDTYQQVLSVITLVL